MFFFALGGLRGAASEVASLFLCCVVYVLYIYETCLVVCCAKQFEGGDGVYDDDVAINHLYQNLIQMDHRRASLTGVVDMFGVNIGHFIFAQI